MTRKDRDADSLEVREEVRRLREEQARDDVARGFRSFGVAESGPTTEVGMSRPPGPAQVPEKRSRGRNLMPWIIDVGLPAAIGIGLGTAFMRTSVGKDISNAFEQFLKRESGASPVPTVVVRATETPTPIELTPWPTRTPGPAATETGTPAPTAVRAEYLEGVEQRVNQAAFNLHCQFIKRDETGAITEQIIVKTPSLRLQLPARLGRLVRKGYAYFLALKSCTFARPPEPGLDWPGNLGVELPTAEVVVVPAQDEQGRALHGAVPLGDGDLDLWKMRAERWPGGPPTTPGIELDVSGETPTGVYALVGGELILYQEGMDLPMGTPILTVDGKLKGVYDQLLHQTTWLGSQTGERLTMVLDQVHQGDPPEESP